MGLSKAAIRSRVIINGRISGSDHQRQDQESDHQRWSAVCAIRGRCDPQSVGPPNAAIRRQVVRGRSPQSMCPVMDSLKRTRSTGLVQPDSLNRTRSAGLIQPDSFNRSRSNGLIQPQSVNRTGSTGLVQPDSFNRTLSTGRVQLVQPDSFNRTT